MEVAVVGAVVDDGAHGVVVSGVDDAGGAGVLAVLQVVGVAVSEDGELEHHRRVLARRGNRETLVVLELVGVAVATGALGGGILGLLASGADGDVAAGRLAAVGDSSACGEGRSGGGGREDGSEDGWEHGGEYGGGGAAL